MQRVLSEGAKEGNSCKRNKHKTIQITICPTIVLFFIMFLSTFNDVFLPWDILKLLKGVWENKCLDVTSLTTFVFSRLYKFETVLEKLLLLSDRANPFAIVHVDGERQRSKMNAETSKTFNLDCNKQETFEVFLPSNISSYSQSWLCKPLRDEAFLIPLMKQLCWSDPGKRNNEWVLA